jgi:hypothetical protein
VAYSAITDGIYFVGSHGLDFRMKCSCKVQGDGINTKVIINLEKPPSGRMTLQDLYHVMLSWVTLKPFDDSIFGMKAEENLLKFGEYLEDMDNAAIESVFIEEI